MKDRIARTVIFRIIFLRDVRSVEIILLLLLKKYFGNLLLCPECISCVHSSFFPIRNREWESNKPCISHFHYFLLFFLKLWLTIRLRCKSRRRWTLTQKNNLFLRNETFFKTTSDSNFLIKKFHTMIFQNLKKEKKIINHFFSRKISVLFSF